MQANRGRSQLLVAIWGRRERRDREQRQCFRGREHDATKQRLDNFPRQIRSTRESGGSDAVTSTGRKVPCIPPKPTGHPFAIGFFSRLSIRREGWRFAISTIAWAGAMLLSAQAPSQSDQEPPRAAQTPRLRAWLGIDCGFHHRWSHCHQVRPAQDCLCRFRFSGSIHNVDELSYPRYLPHHAILADYAGRPGDEYGLYFTFQCRLGDSAAERGGKRQRHLQLFAWQCGHLSRQYHCSRTESTWLCGWSVNAGKMPSLRLKT